MSKISSHRSRVNFLGDTSNSQQRSRQLVGDSKWPLDRPLVGAQSANLEDTVHLDGVIAGQGRDPDRGAGMATLVGEYLHHKVGHSVDHLRMLYEV